MYRNLSLLTALVIPFSFFDNSACFASAEEMPGQERALGLPPAHERWEDLLSGPIEDLNASKCCEAALRVLLDDDGTMSTEPARLALAAKAFARYYDLSPLSEETTPSCEAEIAFINHAVVTYFFLSLAQKQTLSTQFTPLLRWCAVRNPTPSLQTLLMSIDCLFLLGHRDEARLACQRYVSHPESKDFNLTSPILAATAYLVNGDALSATQLYEKVMLEKPRSFSRYNLLNASRAYADTDRWDMSFQMIHMLLNPEKYGLGFTQQDLQPSDYLDAAGCFVGAGDFEGALAHLNNYFAKEKGEIEINAYRLMANCYTHLDDYLTACEYWQIILNKRAFKHASDYLNAATAFSQIGEYNRAAQLIRRALKITPAIGKYEICLQACEFLTRAKDYKTALVLVREYMGLRASVSPDALSATDLVNAAVIYQQNHLYEESAILWDILSLEKNKTNMKMYVNAIYDYLKAGNYKKASNAFLRLSTDEFRALTRKTPYLLTAAILAHQSSGRDNEVKEIINNHRDQLLIIPIGPQKAKTPTLAKTHPKKAKGPSRTSRPMFSQPEMLRALRASHASGLVSQMNVHLTSVRLNTHRALEEICHEMQSLCDQGRHLLTVIETGHIQGDTGAEPAHPSSPSSSSSTSSAAPLVSSSSSAPHLTPEDPLFALQRLSTRMCVLKSEFERTKHALDQQTAKAIKAAWLKEALKEKTLSWDSFSYQASSPHTTSKKGSKRTSKARTSPYTKPPVSQARAGQVAPSSSSSSTSSSSSALPASRVEWRITSTAQKHLNKLKTVRGLQEKFDAFRQEIEMEPWGRRGHAAAHASGRAKRLTGHDNVFSRRFARGERFFYSVDFAEDGRVIITILGLMKHDL